MLRIDHVELRRTLIDYGLWERDGYGKQYGKRNNLADPELAQLVQALAVLEPEQLMASCRMEHMAEREQRKAMALKRDGP